MASMMLGSVYRHVLIRRRGLVPCVIRDLHSRSSYSHASYRPLSTGRNIMTARTAELGRGSVLPNCHALTRAPPSRQYAATSSAYYVLLPEIPPDTPESNAIMRLKDFPRFSEISPDSTITGCAKLSIEFDVGMGKLSEQLNDGSITKSFESVFDPIERLSVPLNYAWRTTKHLNYVKQSSGFREAFRRAHQQVERARNERWINYSLYHAVKELKAEKQSLTESQQRLVDMYLLEARLNGINLTGAAKKEFIQHLGKLVEVKNHFRNRVILSHNLFSHTVSNYEDIKELPTSVLSQLAVDKLNPSRGPWRVNLNQNIYDVFMQYCGNRLTRWNLWQAFNNRASVRQDEQNLSNHINIETIREHRREIAHLLNYNNYAEMSMETKMAGGIENVVSMLEAMRTKLSPIAAQELKDLQQYARSEGFKEKMELWDIPYWRRKQRDHIYKIDADISSHFPYPRVLSGLFDLCQSLFGIIIKDCTGQVDTWHNSVNYYRIYDVNAPTVEIASFYVDPYVRPTEKLVGTWMEPGRERSTLVGTTPFSYLNLNLPPPLHGQTCHLSPEQISTLFHEFGHGLQQMLTTIPYSEISGQRNIEWDSLQTCAKLMEMFSTDPRVLAQLTSDPISPEVLTTLSNSRRHMAAYDTMRQLYLSALDLELYVSEEHWQRVVPRVWARYMPVELNDKEEDNHPCSMTAIFSDQYSAAYYSLKWSEMIAADVFETFDEVLNSRSPALEVVGHRFRDTYLALGGGVPAKEVFRRFSGRKEPSMDALIRRYVKKT